MAFEGVVVKGGLQQWRRGWTDDAGWWLLCGCGVVCGGEKGLGRATRGGDDDEAKREPARQNHDKQAGRQPKDDACSALAVVMVRGRLSVLCVCGLCVVVISLRYR